MLLEIGWTKRIWLLLTNNKRNIFKLPISSLQLPPLQEGKIFSKNLANLNKWQLNLTNYLWIQNCISGGAKTAERSIDHNFKQERYEPSEHESGWNVEKEAIQKVKPEENQFLRSLFLVIKGDSQIVWL